MKPVTLLAVAVTVFVVIAAITVYSRLAQFTPPQQIDVSGLPLPKWAISFGKTDAPITIIELYDLHCPFCAIAHERLDPLYRELLNSGKLRLVFLDLIVHPDALQAHQYLHCAYRQLGNKTYDLITQLYRLLAEDEVNGPGKQLELLQQYKCGDMPSKSDFDNAVNALLKALAQKGVSISQLGTPTFIIIKNGTVNVVVGADVARVISLISQ
ncbi:thioredoxin domain-containing protein [Pyrobaculum aerophilum]|uniref:Thioredoxin domain-containing protein n=2 Tax=Pyrobaculum aerophilum TaxID=13773 RepID=Q8ZTF0_PYRAE|nr:DsbA family protein [Pyrobaculum aerophilum]AAL64811.1 hypothetical protein PAE3285 [Pyrobaculum aerophilum str. IM2]RFA96272.1 protein-disulfide isomerase [Pyrobaculum aerophilum]RFA99234.1 protein-disulfide isomerase [Pyrobaculum aerophilum]HII47578.1 DsbA family protein [Pyrobaculum aerophilum]